MTRYRKDGLEGHFHVTAALWHVQLLGVLRIVRGWLVGGVHRLWSRPRRQFPAPENGAGC